MEARSTFFETSKSKMNWNPFEMDCGSLFLKCKIARPKRKEKLNIAKQTFLLLKKSWGLLQK